MPAAGGLHNCRRDHDVARTERLHDVTTTISGLAPSAAMQPKDDGEHGRRPHSQGETATESRCGTDCLTRQSRSLWACASVVHEFAPGGVIPTATSVTTCPSPPGPQAPPILAPRCRPQAGRPRAFSDTDIRLVMLPICARRGSCGGCCQITATLPGTAGQCRSRRYEGANMSLPRRHRVPPCRRSAARCFHVGAKCSNQVVDERACRRLGGSAAGKQRIELD
jgi:hypothetical protein